MISSLPTALKGYPAVGARVRVDVANLSPAEAVFLAGVIDLLTDPVNWPARGLLAAGNLTIAVDESGIEAGPTYTGN